MRAVGEGNDRGWDGWMASPTQGTWVWVNSRSWWCTGKPGMLQFMGSRRVRHDWMTELNWPLSQLQWNSVSEWPAYKHLIPLTYSLFIWAQKFPNSLCHPYSTNCLRTSYISVSLNTFKSTFRYIISTDYQNFRRMQGKYYHSGLYIKKLMTKEGKNRVRSQDWGKVNIL